MSKVGNYILLKLLSKCPFGEVYFSINEENKKYYATKKYSKKEAGSSVKLKYLENKIQILKELNHPNLCKLEQND